MIRETINLVQCKPVYVTVAKVDSCYMELPVNYRNRLYFTTSNSYILQKTGTPLTTTIFMQPTYKVMNK